MAKDTFLDQGTNWFTLLFEHSGFQLIPTHMALIDNFFGEKPLWLYQYWKRFVLIHLQKYLYVALWILCTFSLYKAFEKNKISAKQLQEMLKCNLEVLSFTQLAAHCA